jgi:hypothetical protein
LVAERSNVGLSRALREGVAHAVSAPAVLLGTFAVARIVDVPAANLSLLDRGARPLLVWLVFWSLAYGGIIDRFARNRPTRAHGFFAACGGHAMALARLAILAMFAIAIVTALRPLAGLWTAALPKRVVVELILLLGSIVLAFARVRLVVEDRRSAFGALLASIRFLRRNPSGIVLLLGFGAAAYALTVFYGAILTSGVLVADWQLRVSNEIFLAAHLWLKLTAYASAIALFQSRLAHAGYTAAPAAIWPESASAEAIANAAPRVS